MWYATRMIRGFIDKDTKKLFEGGHPRRFGANVRQRMIDKLQILNAAARIDDLRIPSGNNLEALSGDRSGHHSIRVNDQWRICFRWEGADAYDVEIVDYH